MFPLSSPSLHEVIEKALIVAIIVNRRVNSFIFIVCVYFSFGGVKGGKLRQNLPFAFALTGRICIRFHTQGVAPGWKLLAFQAVLLLALPT
jgi:hypothetical protein